VRAEETKPLVTPYSGAYASPDATRGEAQGGLAVDADLTPAAITSGANLSATVEARAAFIRFRADGVRPTPDTGVGNIASTDYHPAALRGSLQWSGAAHPYPSLRQTLALAARDEQRAPTSGELLGDNLGILSKLDLRPEEARSVSLSHTLTGPLATGAQPSLQSSLQSTLFWNSYRDPIRLKAHGASSFLRYENDADYRSVGFEALASLTARYTEASLSMTLQEASITEGLYKDNQPAYESPLESHAEFFVKPPLPLWRDAHPTARLGVLADFRSPYYPGDANIPGSRRVAEWEFGAHADAQAGTVRLALDARNLTGRQYRDFAYSPQSGRSYALSFSLAL
jgi:hypothetical protein